MRKLLFAIVILASYLFLPVKAMAGFDYGNVKEVVLVRGSKMHVCPFDGYSETIKQRIADDNPYYSMDEYVQLHPNPTNDWNTPNCTEFLYGQIELVPYGGQPKYVPTEYIYVLGSKILREENVLLAKPEEFSDAKTLYKKVNQFSAINATDGAPVKLNNIVFWFRGTEVNGVIGDVSEGVLSIDGQYMRMDGSQTFVNHEVLWTNPNPEPKDPQAIAVPNPAQITPKLVATSPIPQWYQSGINWVTVPFGTTYEGLLTPDSLQSAINPTGRVIPFKLELPPAIQNTQGIKATFSFTPPLEQRAWITDSQGRQLGRGQLYSDVIDLNTTYLQTNRVVYILAGSINLPASEGAKIRFSFGQGL